MPPQPTLRALPPADAVRFFEQKGYRIGFDWRDVWAHEHSRAFTVAKAMRVDLLEDIRRAVDDAIREGTTLADFQRRLQPLLEAKGWWGRQPVTDPRSGETRIAQLGSPARLKTIFRTNLATSYAAGRWARIERTKASRPYLRYVATLDDRTRPQHRAWHGIVRPVDDAFWQTHYPPNGWNCRCAVQSLSERDLGRYGYELSPPPEIRMVPYRNPRTGETLLVPEGIDPGFGYNAGLRPDRGITPPPRPTPHDPDPGTPTPAPTWPLPPPQAPPPAPLLPPGASLAVARAAFLEAADVAPDQPGVLVDPLGERLPVSPDLFARRDGRPGRLSVEARRAARLLVATIRQPDEVWWRWVTLADDTPALVRRYLARFPLEGEAALLGVLVEVGQDGWSATTTTDAAAVEAWRGGTLAYTRPEA
ncbi:MAG TPA: phage minor head protein [Thermodesulfobacteriota bacterium]